MKRHDALPPVLARCVHAPLDDDDELPPLIGELYRDTLHDIHRAQFEAQQDEKDTQP